MAELHIIGQVVGATGFDFAALFCKWTITGGSSFRLLEGLEKGQTQVDQPEDGEMFIWAHPIDLHYAVKGIQGWPKIAVQVWGMDKFGRADLAGYGFVHIPSSPGTFDLECTTWRPSGTLSEQISSFFIGGNPQLKNEDVVISGADRYRLQTVASGIVKMRFSVIMRDFDKYGVSYGQ